MAFSNIQLQVIKRAGEAFLLSGESPEDLRGQVDVTYRVEGNSVLIHEVRPKWDKPAETSEMPVAKATFVKTHSHWKVYWMGGNLKWQSYSPNPIVESVEGFFDLVIQDDLACFFG